MNNIESKIESLDKMMTVNNKYILQITKWDTINLFQFIAKNCFTLEKCLTHYFTKWKIFYHIQKIVNTKDLINILHFN